MNFQSIGQMVKGHSGDLGAKSKGKTEQSRKLRAKPVGRFQRGENVFVPTIIALLPEEAKSQSQG